MQYNVFKKVVECNGTCDTDDDDDDHLIDICARCLTHIKKNKMPPCCIKNGLSAGPVPLVISNLNIVETRLTCQIYPFLNIVMLPGGQRAEIGQAVSLPCDISKHCKSLPLPLDNIGLILVTSEGDATLGHNVINVQKVKNALQWYKENNKLYSDILVADIFPHAPEHKNNSQTCNHISRTFSEISRLEEKMDHCGTIATNRFMPDITVSEVVTGLNHVPVFSISSPLNPVR